MCRNRMLKNKKNFYLYHRHKLKLFSKSMLTRFHFDSVYRGLVVLISLREISVRVFSIILCVASIRTGIRPGIVKIFDWSVKRSSRCCYFLMMYSRQRERETPFRLRTLNDRSRSRSIDDWSLARFSFFFLILFSWRFLNEYYRLMSWTR